MNDNCLDIGIIQAFLDGEISHAESAEVSQHMAVCDSCAFAFAEAEDEAAIVFPALERELNTLVPTQRLWNKINDSIAIEKEQMPFWHNAMAFLKVSLANPSIAVAASLIVVVGVFAAVLVNRAPVPGAETPGTVEISKTVVTKPAVIENVPLTAPRSSTITEQDTGMNTLRIERASYRPAPRRTSPVAIKAGVAYVADQSAGEESYVNTISTLSRTVEGKKDGVMRPSQRVSFERDMAMVNDTISKMKDEVKRNPKNETARQVLYSSYQNKIDLLNSVAQKEELMASIK
ncbi:MAG: zf-HC2 domain-containing protein [Pyrinomonadaceae bacterium]